MTNPQGRSVWVSLLDKMRMSHVYQPVMLTTLLENGGVASEEKIARRISKISEVLCVR
jgi:hypothetical protein